MNSKPISPVELRKIILKQSKRANVGHIGSALSVADILAALYGGVLRIDAPGEPERDRFVLSKGHAALALYAALHLRDWISAEMLDTYCAEHTLLGVHPERDLPGVDFATGSLGMGVSYACGAALAARLQRSTRRVFALASDAECDEGITWEAALFAAHHGLSNLYLFVDMNGQQALGYTREVLDLSPLAQKWEAFGWDVREVDGHDIPGMQAAVEAAAQVERKPHALIARTTFGKGVSFMESQVKWHYWPMNDAEYAQALREIEP